MCKVIGVVSLKGGVGKTSVVTSLGDAIARLGKKVLLIDGNFSAPNLGLHLNVVDPELTLHDVLARKANIGDAIVNFGNFDILPASLTDKSELNYFLLKDKIKNLKKKYDDILIDSSPSLGDETLAVMLASDGLIVVTTPDVPTLSTTMKAVKLAKSRGTQIDGLVINKVYNKNFELKLDDIEDASSVPVMAVIPHNIHALRAVSEFTPLPTLKPKSKASEEYRRLAASLIGEKYKPVKLKRFFQWVNPTKQDINREIFYEGLFG
ncbi:MAG: AAA family ATPase [Candidatus Pacearchaeota archaeon]|jgi:septum site-determining protein MinD